MTNADVIRSMTDEELAKFLCDDRYPDCLGCPVIRCDGWDADGHAKALEWLRSEADADK